MSPQSDANRRIGLVTGATSGMGEVTARALARGGLSVVLVGRDAQRGLALVWEKQARATSSNESHDPDIARRLWEVSERLTDLRVAGGSR